MRVLILLFSFLIAFSSCKKNDGSEFIRDNEKEIDEIEYPQPEAMKMLLNGSNEFGMRMFKEIYNQEDKNKNIFVSPLSVSMALGMTLNGADGATANDMRSTLDFSNISQRNINLTYRALLNDLPAIDPGVTVQIANSIWSNEQFDILQTFEDTNRYYFNAEVASMDFSDPATKNVINQWVSDVTNGKIKELLDEVRSDHLMFLVNAVYYLADWRYKFDPNNTSKGNFQLMNGNNVLVDMMYSADIPFEYYSNGSMELMNLPYGNGQYSFTAILPSSTSNLDNLIPTLNSADLLQWIDQADTNHGMHLVMPKFELEYKIKLKDVLSSMGMQIAFSDYADFSKMAENLKLSIDQVTHKTYIKLDEEGTEAAAATSVGVVVTSMPPTFSLNRPFIYLIHEKETGAILFMGKMMNPDS